MTTRNAQRHCMIVFNQYPLGETRVQREAEALLRAGVDVDVICRRLGNEPKYDSYKGVRIIRQNITLKLPLVAESGNLQKFIEYILFFFSAFFRLNQLHHQKPYTSIQVHNLPDFLVFCAFLQKLGGIPLILDIHDLMPEFFASRSENSRSIIAKAILWQERLSCKFADQVITVSEHWRQMLIRRGVRADKVSVVMNVADSAVFQQPATGECRLRPDNEFHLVYHGTMVYRYGLDLAIRAVALLRSQIPGIRLTLIGQGEYLPELIKLIDSLNLKECVFVEAKRVAEELPAILMQFDLGIVPYRNDVFTDGLLPTKLMEYAALGIPAVASRTTAIEKYFSGSNVEFFTPCDLDDLARHILLLYREPARLAELSTGNKNFTNRFNWNNISSQYIDLVQDLSSVKHNPQNVIEPHPSASKKVNDS